MLTAFSSIAEMKEAREDAVSKQARLLRKELPALLAQLEYIPDPRDPRKRRHKLTVLLLYGWLICVFQFSSRRESNREITRTSVSGQPATAVPGDRYPATRRYPISAAA